VRRGREALLGGAVAALALACAAALGGPEIVARWRFHVWREEGVGRGEFSQARGLASGRGVRLLRDAALCDPDPDVRYMAIFVLARKVLDAPGAIEALRVIAAQPDADREAIIVPLFDAVFDPAMRPYAREAIVEIACTSKKEMRDRAMALLLAALRDDPTAAARAITRLGALAREGRPGAREALEKIRASDREDFRDAATRELAALPAAR
jgi:hypothetical protein